MDLIPSKLMNVTLESYLIRIDTKSRVIYWIIICLVILTLAALPLIYVDVVIRTGGIFQSETSKQVIYAPVQGRVDFNSVVLGKKVCRGDTLLKFDSRATQAQLKAVEDRLSENHSSVRDLETLINIEDPGSRPAKDNLLTGKYSAEYANLEKAWLGQLRKYQKIRSSHERNELLHKQEIIPDAEYENSLFEYTQEKETLEHILITQKSIWQADLVARKSETNSLMAEKKRCHEELNSKLILAPLSGEIIQSSDLQVGSMVAINQNIAEISPVGDLIALCFVDPKDIGLLNTDQQVKIQVDALNHAEWGFLDARIIDISDDMIVENSTHYYFRIRCKPDSLYLTLKNGIRADIKKGMSFSARIIVTRRSLFNLLFDKVDKWINPYMAKPDQKS